MSADIHKRIPLTKFLEDLPAEAVDGVREASEQMMSNEGVAARLRSVETELRPFFISAVMAFLAGAVFLIFFSKPGGLLDTVAGAWPIMTAALGFLPLLLAYYAFRIRKRSQADVQNFSLNKEFFLPHGAIYFPSDSATGEQMVTLVKVKDAPRSKYDHLKPGSVW